MIYFTYMLRCKDNSIYTGITTNIERRMNDHFSKNEKCAKYTLSHNAQKLESVWKTDNKVLASKLEYHIKQLSKIQKEELIKENNLDKLLSDKIEPSRYERINISLNNLKGEKHKMNQYMKIAKELANKNLKTNDGGPFGACIVKDGKVIGKGSNHVLKNNDPTAHAEMIAIKNACKNINSYDLSDCELYTSCYPCPMCLSAIIWSNIKKVYYGNTKEDADNIGFRDDFIYNYINDLSNDKQDKSILELECMDRDETIEEFNKFANKEDKTIY